MLARRPVAFLLAFALLLGTLLVPGNSFAATPPILSLPIPAGETWKVIQGYNCGTHTSYDDNAFDLVNTNGRTIGAPVTAAADGTYWWGGGANNSIILSHGNGYYTMYSHLRSRGSFKKGQSIPRGTVIGAAGTTGTGVPHLHFEMFHGQGVAASNRVGVPLSFVEGYSFPDTNRCNEHAGALLTAGAVVSDRQAPSMPALIDPGQGMNQIVRWTPATDNDSGVKGYQVYVGSDPAGTGEWFVTDPEVALPTLGPGTYVVRVRSLDNVDNASEWATVLHLTIP